MAKPRYPFVPNSTAFLEPGQFWSVPLQDGRFACGRALQVDDPWWQVMLGRRSSGHEVGRRVGNAFARRHPRCFFGGLMNWCGPHPPTSEDINGCDLVDQAVMHIATIRETGGEILGIRPLSADGLEPGEFLNMHGGNLDWLVLRGMQATRPATPEDRGRIPVYKDLAGVRWIVRLAENAFGPSAPAT